MITAQLGPPPAVPGRASTADGSTGDDAPGTSTATEDGAFVALLLGVGPSADGADETAPHSPAAGPLTGELPTVTDADVAGLTAPPAAGAPPVADATATARAPQVAAATTAAAAAQGVAPSGDAGTAAGIATAGRPDHVAVPASPASPSAAPVSTGGPRRGDASAMPVAAGAPAAPPAPAPAAPTGAATVTITLSRQGGPVAATAEGTPASPASPVTPHVATTPPTPTPAPMPMPTPVPATPSGAPVSGVETPAAAASPPAHVTAPIPMPAAGHVGMPTGVTSAAELAHELGARMRMAVREGGRELVVNLRPPELGHLTVRVTMIDGALTAHITADRPDAVRLLQQSLPQLGTVLGDLGYNLDGLDVTYGGQDRHETPGPGSDGHTADADAHDASDGGSAATPIQSTAAAVTDGDRLDLLV